MRAFAVIPAGGASRRFGSPKLLALLRGKPLLAHVTEPLRAVAEQVLVVCTPTVPELAEVARTAGATVLPLSVPTSDMRATLLQGLDWLERTAAPAAEDVWFLMPGDVPGVPKKLLQELLAAARSEPEVDYFVPVAEGRRGHPLLLRWRQTSAIRSLAGGSGINQLLRLPGVRLREVPTDLTGMLTDVDLPADLEKLR